MQLLPDEDSCLDVLDASLNLRIGRIPVVVIAPAGELDLRVRAVERGVDDYLLQPFGVDELLARLDAALRRRQVRQGRDLSLGGMLVDMATARVGDGLNWTGLSPKEWRVFAALLDRRDQMVSRQHLKQVALGDAKMSDNALEAMICRLRAKAGDLGVSIRALRGAGYMLVEPDRVAVAAAPVA